MLIKGINLISVLFVFKQRVTLNKLNEFSSDNRGKKLFGKCFEFGANINYRYKLYNSG